MLPRWLLVLCNGGYCTTVQNRLLLNYHRENDSINNFNRIKFNVRQNNKYVIQPRVRCMFIEIIQNLIISN